MYKVYPGDNVVSSDHFIVDNKAFFLGEYCGEYRLLGDGIYVINCIDLGCVPTEPYSFIYEVSNDTVYWDYQIKNAVRYDSHNPDLRRSIIYRNSYYLVEEYPDGYWLVDNHGSDHLEDRYSMEEAFRKDIISSRQALRILEGEFILGD